MKRFSKGEVIVRAAYALLAILPLVAFLVTLPFLPDTLPVHFGANGQPDRFGSKGEFAFLPLAIIGFAVLMWFIVKASTGRSEQPARTMSTGLIMLLGALLIFDVLTGWVLGSSMPQFQSVFAGGDLTSFMCALLGLELILCGALAPRLSMNAWSGIRVPWELSEKKWARLQYVGGRLLIVAGALLFVACLAWLRGMQAIMLMIILAVVLCVAILIYGYRLAAR